MKKNMVVLLAAAALSAAAFGEETVKPRLAKASPGFEGTDQVVYSIDAVEWGADPTGKEDCSGVLQRALDRLRDIQGGTLYLPAGRYRLDRSINIEGGVSLRGEWRHPDKGGLGKGTILCVYGGRGETNVVEHAAVKVRSGASLRGVTIWHPEQTAAEPTPYPASVWGDGHTCVAEVTFINSWCGFFNDHCSSMLVRDMYGTCLDTGITGAYAYDIPRIEHVGFDTRYWAQSRLPGSPAGGALLKLNSYVESHLVAIVAGEQDWGYWWDITVDHAKWGVFLTALVSDDGKKMVPGNIAAGRVTMRNVEIGFYLENIGYPGYQITYADVAATKYGVYCPPKPDFAPYKERGVKPAYYENACVVVSSARFTGGESAVRSEKTGRYNLNFNDCVFTGSRDCAIDQLEGTLTLSNCRFSGRAPSCRLGGKVDQAVLCANEWGSAAVIDGWAADDPRIFRDDGVKGVFRAPKYEFDGVAPAAPADRLFDVTAFGAVVGTTKELPAEDSTAAVQRALDAAGAAKGGVVFMPAGVYRLDGALKVPSGVTLRGSFNGQHYGNSTHRGTHLYVYGGKGDEKGAPLITLSRGSACRGFSVFYPEQGISDREEDEAARVKPFPPTIRTASNCRVEDISIVGAWCAVDASTVKSDRLVISDVTGAAMRSCLELGHGMSGGVVRDFHFNLSGWTHQGLYRAALKHSANPDKSLTEYTTREVKGLVLGDAHKVNFFSCFNILVAEQVVLEKDPYTGGDFNGKMWGVAFDAAGHGVVGRAGSAGKIAIIASMGVFNQQGGGYYIKTEPGFKGTIVLFNADVWSDRSQLACVEGGYGCFVQLFSWCCGKGVVTGGRLDVLSSIMVSNNGDNDKGDRIDFTYGKGSSGSVIGTADCRKLLHLVVEDGADLKLVNNGILRPASAP